MKDKNLKTSKLFNYVQENNQKKGNNAAKSKQECGKKRLSV